MKLYMSSTGMIYGYCVIDMDKYKKNNLAFLKNKLLRLLIPYLFWGGALWLLLWLIWDLLSNLFSNIVLREYS